MDYLGAIDPGPNSRGMSIPGFLRAFPDNESCLNHLFWVRGGHEMPCRLCGRPTTWKPIANSSKFRSRCCSTTLSCTRDTLFYQSQQSLWLWYYTLVLVFNLSAFPSADFLGRHLGIDRSTAWHMLRKIRRQVSQICARASGCLFGETVGVESLRFNSALSKNGLRTQAATVLVVAAAQDAFAFVLPRRHPKFFREILDRLEVGDDIFAGEYETDLHRLRAKLGRYRLNVRRQDWSPAAYDLVSRAKSLSIYLRASVAKRHPKLHKENMQSYLSEFVFRFNFATNKAVLFPLFMMSLDRITYCDEQASAKILRLGGNIPGRLS